MILLKWVIETEQDKEFSLFSYFFFSSDKTNQKGPCYNLSRSLIVSVDISQNRKVFVDNVTYINSQILRHDTEWRIAPLGATELAVSCDHGDERFHGEVVRCPNFARVMPGLEPKANFSKKQKVLRDISGEKEAKRNWRPLDCSEPSSSCLYPVIYFCCANADCWRSKARSCRRRTDGSWLLAQWGVFQAHTLRGAQEDWRKVRGFLRHLACISDKTQTKDNVSKSPNRLRDLQSLARVFFHISSFSGVGIVVP